MKIVILHTQQVNYGSKLAIESLGNILIKIPEELDRWLFLNNLNRFHTMY